MTRLMDFLVQTSPGYIRCAPDYEGWPGYGDWLSINANTPRDLIGTAFLAYDAGLMAQIAVLLGHHEDAAHYQQLFEEVKTAFGNRYLVGSVVPAIPVTPSETRRQMDQADRLSQGNLRAVDYGQVTSEVFNTAVFTPTQTAYVLALHFDLLPENLRSLAIHELVADLERREMHLSTGFVGSPYLNHVLSRYGRLDAAYALLNQKSWPSWLYAVTNGATTIWECWDGWTQENGFQTPEMNSFNHYTYGAIGAWMYNTITGIVVDPAVPGYKQPLVLVEKSHGEESSLGFVPQAKDNAVTTQDFIIELSCRVDTQMGDVRKHPQAKLYPSEVVALALLFALKGVGTRAFYRWLTRDYRHLFPHLPERTRLFRAFKQQRIHANRFLAPPSLLGLIDSFGIELIHPRREVAATSKSDAKGSLTAAGLSAVSCVCC